MANVGRKIKPGNRANMVRQPIQTTGQQQATAIGGGADYLAARGARPIDTLSTSGTKQPPNAGGPAPPATGDDKQTPRDRAGERGDDRFNPDQRGGNPRDVSVPNRGAPPPTATPPTAVHPDMQNLVNALHAAHTSPNVDPQLKQAIGAHIAALPPGMKPQDDYLHMPRPSATPAPAAPANAKASGDFIPGPGGNTAQSPPGLDMASAANFNQGEQQATPVGRVASAPIPRPTPPVAAQPPRPAPVPPSAQAPPGTIKPPPGPAPATIAPGGSMAVAQKPGEGAAPAPTPPGSIQPMPPSAGGADQPPRPTTSLGRAQQFASTLPVRPGGN